MSAARPGRRAGWSALLLLGAVAAAGCSKPTLFFQTPPISAEAGVPLNPALQVALHDANDNLDKANGRKITLQLEDGFSGTFGGTLTRETVEGVATFEDLTIDLAGSHNVTASSQDLESIVSSTFSVNASTATQLRFKVQPSEASAGTPFAPPVEVELLDAYGNRREDTDTPVTLSMGNNPTGAAVTGVLEVKTLTGVASFSDVAVNRPGQGYTLIARSPSLTDASSAAFRVVVGTPARLGFVTPQPVTATAGATLAPALQVAVQDLGGNTVPSTLPITLAVRSGPAGGISGTLTVSAVAGIATFSNLTFTKAGTYRLGASAGGVTGAVSAELVVSAGAASQLQFVVPPAVAHLNRPITPAVQVGITDAFGNVVAGAPAATVTVALGNNPSGAVLGGTLTAATSNGVATFATLSLNQVGVGFTLTASGGGYPTATSPAFDSIDPRLTYVDPPAGGKVRLVRNAASTNTTVVLDLIAQQPLVGYSVGMNLPVDPTRVVLAGTPMTPGTVLDPGSAPAAWKVALPADGPLKDVLVSGLSQKAAGNGAVAGDSAIASGAVLYTLRLDLSDAALKGVVFDGVTPGARFRAVLRDRLGQDVVTQPEFGIGKLEVQ